MLEYDHWVLIITTLFDFFGFCVWQFGGLVLSMVRF
jgi:hypothetical protein